MVTIIIINIIVIIMMWKHIFAFHQNILFNEQTVEDIEFNSHGWLLFKRVAYVIELLRVDDPVAGMWSNQTVKRMSFTSQKSHW